MQKAADAKPTKDFFISMLVKDIGLIRSIIDLVDNSIDGALRLSPNGDFKHYKIDLTVHKDQFNISDNCGGISRKDAEDYAFRFGRPEASEATKGSIGLFGVGMKRAIFKLGSKFKVSSKTNNESFVVGANIEKWKLDEKTWSFPINSDSVESLSEPGTIVEVSSLHENVIGQFEDDRFIIKLREEIELAHMHHVENGMTICLNGYQIKAKQLNLYDSKLIKAGKREIQTELKGGTSVDVKIIAGIANPAPEDAGWYIFCNERLILSSDTSKTTGWGITGSLPKYHNDYSYFRGYIFFKSEQPRALPWNTTKTGVDEDSPLYQSMRVIMDEMTKPVLSSLKQRRKEASTQSDDQQRPLLAALDEAQIMPIQEIDFAAKFTFPASNVPIRTRNRRIHISIPAAEFNRALIVSEQDNADELGKYIFYYFYDRECELI